MQTNCLKPLWVLLSPGTSKVLISMRPGRHWRIVLISSRAADSPITGVEGVHPVHDAQIKRYHHPNSFQHECLWKFAYRVSGCRVAESPWSSRTGPVNYRASPCCSKPWHSPLPGRCHSLPWRGSWANPGIASMPFTLNMSIWPSMPPICPVFVPLPLTTSCQHGHGYLILVADADERRVIRHRRTGCQNRRSVCT